MVGKIDTLEEKMRKISERVFSANDIPIEDQLIKKTIDKIKCTGDKSKAPIDETIEAVKKIWDECELTSVEEGDIKRRARYDELANLGQALHASLVELDRTQNDHRAVSIYKAIDSLMAISNDQPLHHVMKELRSEWENLKASSSKTEQSFTESPVNSDTEGTIETITTRKKRGASKDIYPPEGSKLHKQHTASSFDDFETIKEALRETTTSSTTSPESDWKEFEKEFESEMKRHQNSSEKELQEYQETATPNRKDSSSSSPEFDWKEFEKEFESEMKRHQNSSEKQGIAKNQGLDEWNAMYKKRKEISTQISGISKISNEERTFNKSIEDCISTIDIETIKSLNIMFSALKKQFEDKDLKKHQFYREMYQNIRDISVYLTRQKMQNKGLKSIEKSRRTINVPKSAKELYENINTKGDEILLDASPTWKRRNKDSMNRFISHLKPIMNPGQTLPTESQLSNMDSWTDDRIRKFIDDFNDFDGTLSNYMQNNMPSEGITGNDYSKFFKTDFVTLYGSIYKRRQFLSALKKNIK